MQASAHLALQRSVDDPSILQASWDGMLEQCSLSLEDIVCSLVWLIVLSALKDTIAIAPIGESNVFNAKIRISKRVIILYRTLKKVTGC